MVERGEADRQDGGQRESNQQGESSNQAGVKKHNYYLLEPSQFTEEEKEEMIKKGEADRQDGRKSDIRDRGKPADDSIKKHHYYELDLSQFSERETVGTEEDGAREGQEGSRLIEDTQGEVDMPDLTCDQNVSYNTAQRETSRQ